MAPVTLATPADGCQKSTLPSAEVRQHHGFGYAGRSAQGRCGQGVIWLSTRSEKRSVPCQPSEPPLQAAPVSYSCGNPGKGGAGGEGLTLPGRKEDNICKGVRTGTIQQKREHRSLSEPLTRCDRGLGAANWQDGAVESFTGSQRTSQQSGDT